MIFFWEYLYVISGLKYFIKCFLAILTNVYMYKKKLSEFISAYSNIKVRGVSVKDFNKKKLFVIDIFYL